MPRPRLLAVDWGSSSLRGALLDAQGGVLAEQTAPRGLLNVPPGGWAAAFDAEFGAWRQRWPELPCLMAGMVGSRQGWAEAPYCPCPAAPADLALQLLWVEPGRIAIVPGLCIEHDGLPDVMRGEETQVFGALQLLALRDATLVLPGTHSKWVRVHGGRVVDFTTHMSGECYALWRRHSMLARSLPAEDGAFDDAAFEAGIALAQRPGGLLHHLFSTRTLSLFDRHAAEGLPSYLSGLVVGEELRTQARQADATRVVLVGADALTARYRRGLALLGVSAECLGSEAGWCGLATLAGIIAPS